MRPVGETRLALLVLPPDHSRASVDVLAFSALRLRIRAATRLS